MMTILSIDYFIAANRYLSSHIVKLDDDKVSASFFKARIGSNSYVALGNVFTQPSQLNTTQNVTEYTERCP